MSIVKYATVEEVLEVKSSPNRLSFSYDDAPGQPLVRFAAMSDGLRKEDDYLYVRCRAISSRVNKNNDGWPAEELQKAYSTFLGRPIFVDHNNDDPSRTRGVVVDAALHVSDPDDDKTSSLDPYYSTAPDNHKPPTWIELLMEVDAKTFPKLASAIESGDLDAVSMGANIERSVCSVCANEATTSDEYCSHVKQKGLTFEITSDNGEQVRKKAYEDCYGVNFFEISNVFDPADETADSGLAFKGASLDANSLSKSAKDSGISLDELIHYLDSRGEYEVVERLSKIKQSFDEYDDPNPDPVCPECGSTDIRPSQSFDHSLWECMGCGKIGYIEEFNGQRQASRKEGLDIPQITEFGVAGAGVVSFAIRRFKELRQHQTREQAIQTLASDLEQKGVQPEAVNKIMESVMSEPYMDHKVHVDLPDGGNHQTDIPRAPKPGVFDLKFKSAAAPEESLIAPVNQQITQDDDRNYIPQSDKTTAPQEVDTLRDENQCPICHAGSMEADPDGIEKCPVCGHVAEPEPLNNPDLSAANQEDAVQREHGVNPEANPMGGDQSLTDPLDSIEFSQAPAMATSKTNITRRGISEMFTTKLRTNSKKKADTLLPAQKLARRETKFANGVHRGVYEAATKAGLNVRVSYPAIERKDNVLDVPGKNGIFNLFLAEESAAKLNVPMNEVPIVVEGKTNEDVEKFVSLLEATPRPSRVAAGDKTPILPPSSRPSDEPKKETVVSDELSPTESKTFTVTEDKVTIGDKTYQLVTVDDEEGKKDDLKAEVKDAEETDESKKEVDESDDTDDSDSDEREARLLAAFTLADLSVDMGLVDQSVKMAYIAELEDDSLDTINAKLAMLKRVKEAGLGKREANNSLAGIKRLPRLSHTSNLNGNTNGSLDVPDEALFM